MKTTTKKILSSFILWILFTTIIVFIFGMFFQFNIISGNEKSFNMTTFFASILIFLILGTFAGNIHNKKGILVGLLYSLIVLGIVQLFSFLGLNQTFDVKDLLKISIQILSSMLGGMLGVNFKPIIK